MNALDEFLGKKEDKVKMFKKTEINSKVQNTRGKMTSSKQTREELKVNDVNTTSVGQFNAGIKNLKLEEPQQTESSYASQLNSFMDDPLIEEKRYLVTMIYTSFT